MLGKKVVQMRSAKRQSKTSIYMASCYCLVACAAILGVTDALTCLVGQNDPAAQDCGGNQTHCCKIAMCASVEKNEKIQGPIQNIYNFFCYPNSEENEPKLDGTSNEDVQGNVKMIMSNGMHCCDSNECATQATEVPEINCNGLDETAEASQRGSYSNYYDYYGDYSNNYNDYDDEWLNEERGEDQKDNRKKMKRNKKVSIKKDISEQTPMEGTKPSEEESKNEERKESKEEAENIKKEQNRMQGSKPSEEESKNEERKKPEEEAENIKKAAITKKSDGNVKPKIDTTKEKPIKDSETEDGEKHEKTA